MATMEALMAITVIMGIMEIRTTTTIMETLIMVIEMLGMPTEEEEGMYLIHITEGMLIEMQ